MLREGQFRATLKARMIEQRIGGFTEQRKMTPNRKRLNRGTVERRKGGKSPNFQKDGMIENHSISQKEGTPRNVSMIIQKT